MVLSVTIQEGMHARYSNVDGCMVVTVCKASGERLAKTGIFTVCLYLDASHTYPADVSLCVVEAGQSAPCNIALRVRSSERESFVLQPGETLSVSVSISQQVTLTLTLTLPSRHSPRSSTMSSRPISACSRSLQRRRILTVCLL